MAKNIEENSNNLNIIGNGTSIVGDIVLNGDLRIDGELKGNLNTKSKVVLGSTANIIGEINCKNSEISGVVNGKITVDDLLILRSTAKIYGDIITAKLSVEPGAIFTGTCDMNGGSSSEKDKK
ncbi:polymer-forming cytoskeletal protein [Bacteroidales bacterium OttesenSCG-928-I21]|nr:polymer-forming cytoskeletal protein [Bacteroidales bacterium OttesenSCG-928-I21]